MKNINDYKKRFDVLLESTMGDVKPLISEQNETSKKGANIKPDTSKLFKGALFMDVKKSLNTKDEVVTGSYTAVNQKGAYDALHSFHKRSSDGFGGRINTKVQDAIKEYKKKNGVKAVDIKKMDVDIDSNTLTVDWAVTIGPSTNNKTYEEFDSRGSAGGGEAAVNKQLDKMHGYHSGKPKLVYHYNETIPICFDSMGKKLKGGCKGKINIQQKFFKYGK